jgi:circadian clock protein KaiB
MAKRVSHSAKTRLKLRLYVAGAAPNSLRAIANLKAMCAKHFANHDLEIINLMVEPERAGADRVIVTPTLITLGPGPHRRLIGDLGDEHKLLAALGGHP